MFQQKQYISSQSPLLSTILTNTTTSFCLFLNAACCSLNDRLSVGLARSKNVRSVNGIQQMVKFNFTATLGDVQEN